MKQDIRNMRQDILDKDVITEDMIYSGTGENGLRITNKCIQKFTNDKPTFTNEYIEAITSDERFINALMLNDNFIKNIKAIVGGTK